MVRKADDELRLIAKHLRPGVRNSNNRSSLFRWLYERSDAFQRLLDDSQPSWKSVADALAVLDLRDGAGKLPTPVRIRRTWFEVRRAKGWLAKAPTSAIPVPQNSAETRLNVSATSAANTMEPVSPSQAHNPRQSALDRMRAQFKPITLPQKQEKPRDQ